VEKLSVIPKGESAEILKIDISISIAVP
jgi:hypothetical protein